MLIPLFLAWLAWTDTNGTLWVTDDAKRVPARYRTTAVEITPKPFACYPRITPLGMLARETAACTKADEAPLGLPR